MAYSRLRRSSDQRKALLRELITDLILNGQIETTVAKARELHYILVVKQLHSSVLKKMKKVTLQFKSYLTKLLLSLLIVMVDIQGLLRLVSVVVIQLQWQSFNSLNNISLKSYFCGTIFYF